MICFAKIMSTPKFADTQTWQQAELLMQPAFIRLIDNIRKQLEDCTWKSRYQDVQIWPEGTSEETKALVEHLRQELANASPEVADEIQQRLAQLPVPYPGYELHLEQQGHHVSVDLWELCYRICFRNYEDSDRSGQPTVEIDTSLIDETGDVDWNRLDEKTQRLVHEIFANLPTS